jgi:hypothetical protein
VLPTTTNEYWSKTKVSSQVADRYFLALNTSRLHHFPVPTILLLFNKKQSPIPNCRRRDFHPVSGQEIWTEVAHHQFLSTVMWVSLPTAQSKRIGRQKGGVRCFIDCPAI